MKKPSQQRRRQTDEGNSATAHEVLDGSRLQPEVLREVSQHRSVTLPAAAFDFSGARKVLTMSSEYDGESSVGGRIVSGGIAG